MEAGFQMKLQLWFHYAWVFALKPVINPGDLTSMVILLGDHRLLGMETNQGYLLAKEE